MVQSSFRKGTMNSNGREGWERTIMRLADVLRCTGLSRSTLYNRIASREFPKQVSLGGRSIGWLKAEVEEWIAKRAGCRSEGVPVPTPLLQPTREMPDRTKGSRSSKGQAGCLVSFTEGSPNLAHLHLVGAKLYFNGTTGTFWIKLVAEGSAIRG